MKRYIKNAPRNIREEQKSFVDLAELVYEYNYLESLGLTEEEIENYKKENKRR